MNFQLTSVEGGFEFIDLFAGIGGFHQALHGLGGKCIFASEIDANARDIYELNFTVPAKVHGDIIPLTEPVVHSEIPEFTGIGVVAGGFPCQPFSKSGHQFGIEDARGTLFFNIYNLLRSRKPTYVLLENVKNLLGPKHVQTWHKIRELLRELGYWIPENPAVFSPHFLPPEMGGAPQNRERVFIVGKYVGPELAQKSKLDLFRLEPKPVAGWDPENWDVFKHLVENERVLGSNQINTSKVEALKIWIDFVKSIGTMGTGNKTLPGFPLWEFAFVESPELHESMPKWEVSFRKKNSEFYLTNSQAINSWRKRNPLLQSIATSFRKFEWQAGDEDDFNRTAVQFRPSGVRVKKANYLPTLVALNQTSYLPRLNRNISVREAAKLQSFKQDFRFGAQSDELSYKQLGNAVSVSTVRYVFSKYLEHFAELGI